MKHPLISIVIPTRSRNSALNRLLHSIELSSYKNKEVIIINDGGDAVSSETSKCTLLTNTHSRGLAYSRSVGAKKSKGKYILFIDDDNVVDPHMIENLVSSFENHPKLLAVGPLTYYLSNKKKIWFVGSKLSLLTSMPRFYRSFTKRQLIDNSLFPTDNLHNCFMISRQLGEEVGWLDEKVFMNGTEFDLFQRIKKKHGDLFLATNVEAICYHDVPEYSKNMLRSMGFDTKRRVYYFQRNRGLHVGRYGKWYEKVSLFFVFYPVFLVGYSLFFILKGRLDFLLEHVKATFVGYYYLLKG